MSSKYYICINVERTPETNSIHLPKTSSLREVENLCSKLEQFILASLRSEVQKQINR
jgi:hypothetical protein